MQPDINELRAFYGQPLGRVARRLIGQRIATMWPDLTGCRVLGMGYATPYLRSYLKTAERVIGFMPGAQGVVGWPSEGPFRTCLVDPLHLPLPDESMDRVLIVHSLETADSLRQTLRQVWRVVAPEGRVLFVVPNRRSLWARVEIGPFAHGMPYSRGQIARLLRDNLFTARAIETALYLPPLDWRSNLRLAGAWEAAGRRFGSQFAGVLIVEATKQVYPEPVQPGRRFRLQARVPGMARPAMPNVAKIKRNIIAHRREVDVEEKRIRRDEDDRCDC